jgi:hypothetical protein
MIVDIVDKYCTDDNNPIKNQRLRIEKFFPHVKFILAFLYKKMVEAKAKIVTERFSIHSIISRDGILERHF